MPNHRFQKGFTMIELLVAMAILGVLFVAMYQMFNSSLTTSVQTSTRAELDGETQKVQQLLINRMKEADLFLSANDVKTLTYSDIQDSSTAYYPSSTLNSSSIVAFRVPTKNSPSKCYLYVYYVVPSSNLVSASITKVQHRLNHATTGANSLIEGRTDTTFDCTKTTPTAGNYPTVNTLRILHPSLHGTTGFVVTPYMNASGTVQKGVSLSLQAHRQAGNKTITTDTYSARVVARNVQ